MKIFLNETIILNCLRQFSKEPLKKMYVIYYYENCLLLSLPNLIYILAMGLSVEGALSGRHFFLTLVWAIKNMYILTLTGLRTMIVALHSLSKRYNIIWRCLWWECRWDRATCKVIVTTWTILHPKGNNT